MDRIRLGPRHSSGIQSVSWGMAISAIVTMPFGLVADGTALLTPSVLAAGLVVAVLSSVTPNTLEMAGKGRVEREGQALTASSAERGRRRYRYIWTSPANRRRHGRPPASSLPSSHCARHSHHDRSRSRSGSSYWDRSAGVPMQQDGRSTAGRAAPIATRLPGRKWSSLCENAPSVVG